MESNTAKLFDAIININELNHADIEKAKEIFSEYMDKQIITNCKFEDHIWHTTDEYSNTGLHFSFNELLYKKYYEELFGITLNEFIQYVKVFIVFSLGKVILHTLQSILNDLKRLFGLNPEEIYTFNSNLFISAPNYIIDFLGILPVIDEENTNRLINALDEYANIKYSKNTDNKRELVSFDSYFMFNDIINDYWNSDIPYKERLFYYPLYLFWQITGIIPLRPREFILTQRNCLEKRDDGYYLTLRRNKIKGGNKKISYKIENDYELSTYKIPDKLAITIQEYISYTNHYESTELDTLFVTDPHFHHWNQKKHSNSRYFTYINMNTLMKYFYREVIINKYGISVVYDKVPQKNEINFIHLGDTRHIALINIIAEGNSPVTAMLLAGHDDINTSAHYYSNISNLIECKTYRQYRQITGGKVNYQLSKYNPLPNISEHIELSDGAKCYSEQMRNGNISDCMNSSGPAGEIAYCPNCKYYRKNYSSFYSVDERYKKSIKNASNQVARMVQLYRNGKGDIEDIGTELLKLKSSAYNYQQYFSEKIAYKLSKGDDIWEERN